MLLCPPSVGPVDPAWFLDLDGTLLDFAAQPAAVEPTPRFRALLRRLAGLEHGAVAFVSGRSLAELDRLLAPYRFAAAAVHGVERRTQRGELHGDAADHGALIGPRAALEWFRDRHPGILLEDKGSGLALHYRQRPDLERTVAQLAKTLAAELPPSLELLEGRDVLEVKAAGADKGSAIRAFMREAPFAGRTPVFIGDDVTDEAGFGAVNALGGVSIKVSEGSTIARWRLPDVAAVFDWLERVLCNGEAGS